LAKESSQQDEVLLPGEVLVDGGELPGHADAAAHGVGVALDIVSQHAGFARIGPQQRRQDADGGRLAGAVGPQQPVDAAGGHEQIEPVDRARVAEALDEPRSLHRWCGHAHCAG
jgi:hypothetical protein